MFNRKTIPPRVSEHWSPVQVKDWLANQRYLVSYRAVTSIKNNRLAIHEMAGDEWIASLDWGGEWIVVIEPENVMSPYEFRAFNSALNFLDALLLHHFIKTTEDPREHRSVGCACGLRNAAAA